MTSSEYGKSLHRWLGDTVTM